ncbi:hypothetical protein CDD83_3123 [Cordyceps sp. RAO-2017]|nr:hypothetical protein CDD83_3123 [Cordyceps sp. RAO-2017]
MQTLILSNSENPDSHLTSRLDEMYKWRTLTPALRRQLGRRRSGGGGATRRAPDSSRRRSGAWLRAPPRAPPRAGYRENVEDANTCQVDLRLRRGTATAQETTYFPIRHGAVPSGAKPQQPAATAAPPGRTSAEQRARWYRDSIGGKGGCLLARAADPHPPIPTNSVCLYVETNTAAAFRSFLLLRLSHGPRPASSAPPPPASSARRGASASPAGQGSYALPRQAAAKPPTDALHTFAAVPGRG